jgi:hypothetical protein
LTENVHARISSTAKHFLNFCFISSSSLLTDISSKPKH